MILLNILIYASIHSNSSIKWERISICSLQALHPSISLALELIGHHQLGFGSIAPWCPEIEEEIFLISSTNPMNLLDSNIPKSGPVQAREISIMKTICCFTLVSFTDFLGIVVMTLLWATFPTIINYSTANRTSRLYNAINTPCFQYLLFDKSNTQHTIKYQPKHSTKQMALIERVYVIYENILNIYVTKIKQPLFTSTILHPLETLVAGGRPNWLATFCRKELETSHKLSAEVGKATLLSSLGSLRLNHIRLWVLQPT